MDSWKTKYLFPVLGMIPIDRSGGSKVAVGPRGRRRRAAPRRAVRHLPRGHAQPRRPAAQGTHRRGPAGPRGRCARSIPSASSAPTSIQPPDAKAPKLFGSCSITIGRPIRPERYAATPRAAPGAAVDDRRGDVRDPRAHRPGVRRPLRRQGRRRRAERRRTGPADPRRRVARRADATRTTADWRASAELSDRRRQPPAAPARALRRLRAMDAPITITLPDGSAPGVPGRDHRRRRRRRRSASASPRPPSRPRVDGDEVDLGRPLARRRPRWRSSPTTPTPAATCCATRRRT